MNYAAVLLNIIYFLICWFIMAAMFQGWGRALLVMACVGIFVFLQSQARWEPAPEPTPRVLTSEPGEGRE